MLGNKEGLVSVHVCICVYVCAHTRSQEFFFYLGKGQEEIVLRKRQGGKKMSENSIFVMFYVSIIYLYNRQGAQMEGLGPGS